MEKIFRMLALYLVLLAFALPSIVHAQRGTHVDVITVTGAIDTWVDGYLDRAISVAEQDGATAAIVVLNTPGGSVSTTLRIIQRFAAARVPIIVYVSPRRAQAASAGSLITLGAHLNAMAPETIIGAATPINSTGENINSDLRNKAINDLRATMRTLTRNRPASAGEWAERAISNAETATDEQALKLGVTDFIVNDLKELLTKLDGKKVNTATGEVTLRTQNVEIVNLDMNFSEIFLHTIVDPNLALILLQIGLLAIAVELYNPGATIPAVVGAICLVLAFVALGNLPVNWGGVILIFLGIGALVLDVKVSGFVLSIGGILMLILGGLLLFTPFTPFNPSAPEFPEVSVSPWVVFGSAFTVGAFFVFLLGAAIRGRKFPVVSGTEALIGATGIATSDLNPNGTVHVRGEVWTASAQGDIIGKGQEVKVVAVEGLRLRVQKK